MSGLSVTYWQVIFDKTLPIIEELIHKKLDKIDKLYSITTARLSNWHNNQIKELEYEIQNLLAFLEINEQTQKSYLEESYKIANCQIGLWKENKILRKELDQKDKQIEVLLKKYYQTIQKLK